MAGVFEQRKPGHCAEAGVAAVRTYLERSAALDMEEYPRWGYERMDAHRTALADYIGCPVGELALTHNATEAIGIVASGLDLKAGDEVLTTDQEHPSGRGPVAGAAAAAWHTGAASRAAITAEGSRADCGLAGRLDWPADTCAELSAALRRRRAWCCLCGRSAGRRGRRAF